jgi:tetratricopeptide (TPR) repeat protein
VTQTPDPNALSEAAIKAHASGDLAEAARLYDEVLAIEPRHWLAMTNRATLLMQSGRLEEGIVAIRASLAIAPSQPTALDNLGVALGVLGRLDEAIAALREAVALKADFALAWIHLGGALHQAGRPEEALIAYGSAAEHEPTASQPRHAQGLLLYELGRGAEALALLERALALGPQSPELMNDLGLLLHDQGRAEDAAAAFERALVLKPDYPMALSNLARVLHHLDRMPEALARVDQAIALDPAYATAWLHRGDVLSATGRFDEALHCYDRLLELEPAHVDAWVRRGDVLGFLRRIEEAMVAYNQALTLDPGNIKAPTNLAAALLREGAYGDGWRLYEHRWRDPEYRMPVLNGRHWTGGEPVDGQTILLHSEQGLGDTLMMLRYAPLLARRGATVLLSVQPALERLAASVQGVKAVIPQGQAIPPFDLHIPMMSLPMAFGTEWETVAGEPYLSAPPQDVARWAERLGPKTRPRIGLCWSGNPAHADDRWRSIPLEALRPLAALDADLYTVQTDIRDRDAAAAQAMGLTLLGPELTDYASTAGLVENLDLIVTVDTSLAHLVGGMGRSGVVLLAAVPDYRWAWDEPVSPWYPGLKLLRQERVGDWGAVVEEVRAMATWMKLV